MRRMQTQAEPELRLLFGDSAKISVFPTITRCWMPIGRQRVILMPRVRAAKRWNSGAVDAVAGRAVHVIDRRSNVGFRRPLVAISRAYRYRLVPSAR